MTVNEGALGEARRRSDQVRARRARRVRKVERAADSLRTSSPRKRSLRRRHDVMVPGELGTEMQLPAMPSLHLGPRLFSVAILGFCMWSLVRFLNADRFAVSQIETAGQQLLSTSQIRSLIGVEGKSIFLVDPESVEQALEEESEVMEASVSIRWPNRVVAEIVERPPSVEWNDGGRIWWLSEDGVAYVQHGERSGLIQIESEMPYLNIQEDPTAEVVDPDLISAAQDLMTRLPGMGKLLFDPDHGLGFEAEEGWKVYFGIDGDMRIKADIYEAVAEKLKKDGIPATFVSIENKNAPYYEVESHYSWQP
jgi:hypothetical protein